MNNENFPAIFRAAGRAKNSRLFKEKQLFRIPLWQFQR
jgi:hypothetical protein